MATFHVTPTTPLSQIEAALAAVSPYDRVVFEVGSHHIAGQLDVGRAGLTLEIADGATLSPTAGVTWMFDVAAPGVTVTGAGTFDGGAFANDIGFRGFIYVCDSADGFHAAGLAKPTPSSQAGALSFTGTLTAITVDGAHNVVLENLYLHDFRAGTYGLILRDLNVTDGVNALGGQGNVIRDIYAHGGSGGHLSGDIPTNGAWIRLDSSDFTDPNDQTDSVGIAITDTILMGGSSAIADNGRTYYFVNIDSNVQNARDIQIAYNTLAGAVSYEIQIKSGFESAHGIQDVMVHDNIMDHSAPDLLRRWPLKVQTNYDDPFQVSFENNLALLQPGYGSEALHLEIGTIDYVGYHGDFVTDRMRTVMRLDTGKTGPLLGTDGDDWLIVGGATEVTSGAGYDLIDIRLGDGAVTVTDFEIGVDQLRLVGFGTRSPLDLVAGAAAELGQIRLGGGDQVTLMSGGVALDLSDFTSADIVLAQTRPVLFSPENGSGVTGGAAPEQIIGSDLGEILRGGAGADVIAGGLGRDWIYGEDGDDRLQGGQNMDRLWGGDGADVFVFGSNMQLNIVYDFTLGHDRISLLDATYDDLTILVYAGVDSDIRLPDGSRLVLRGITPDQLSHRDFILSAEDRSGSAGQGDVAGGAGSDWLHGSNQDDQLTTSAGLDRLWGYAGADTFVFTEFSALNIIYDFETGADQIGLDGVAYEDLTIFMYNDTDTEIRGPNGERLVLREVGIDDLAETDFFVF